MGNAVRLWSRRGVGSADIREAAPPPTPLRVPSLASTGISRLGLDPSAQQARYLQDFDDANRDQTMGDLLDSYLACVPASAAIGAVARTVTAGGPLLHSRRAVDSADTRVLGVPAAAKPLQQLLDFVNPKQDARQFFRGVCTDALTFGDSFSEVVWWLGRPVALYDLDAATMRVDADAHGNVRKYVQKVGTRVVEFKPHQVIQVSYDSPRGSVYGIGPLQMVQAAVNLWIFTTALLKERMRKGNPPTLHFDTAVEVPEASVTKFVMQYLQQNIGIQNIGLPIVTRGMTLNELKVAAIPELIAVQKEARDIILSGIGVPPAQVSVIETGNLGGGTGTSQFKTFRVNTCEPVGAMVMEKFNYHLTWEAFRLPDVLMLFREIDWRDDKTIDEIASLRVRDGRWTVNRARDEIGEPPISGGDEAFIVNRQDMVLIGDIGAYSKASLAAKQGAASGNPVVVTGLDDDGKTPIRPGAGNATTTESIEALNRSWAALQERRRHALREFANA